MCTKQKQHLVLLAQCWSADWLVTTQLCSAGMQIQFHQFRPIRPRIWPITTPVRVAFRSTAPKPVHPVTGSSHTVLPAVPGNTGLENGIPEGERRNKEMNPVILQSRKHVNKHLNRRKTQLYKHAHHPKLSNQETTSTPVDNTGWQGWRKGIQDFDFLQNL